MPALLLGLGSAAVSVFAAYRRQAVHNGVWRTFPLASSPEAGMHARALIALVGVLALDRSETLYYSATRDSEGRRLSCRCDYRIDGGPFATRWWSLTAYGGDGFLIPNAAGRYSFSATTVTTGADGRWSVLLSAEPQEGDWLPAGDADRIDLLLRFYNPEPELYRHLDTVALPTITRVR
jgi:hypothetical protein